VSGMASRQTSRQAILPLRRWYSGKCVVYKTRFERCSGTFDSYSPLDEDTISLEILDCLRERGESRVEEASLLRNMHAKKSSFVAPAGCESLPEGP
jgi:hypothetical protein